MPEIPKIRQDAEFDRIMSRARSRGEGSSDPRELYAHCKFKIFHLCTFFFVNFRTEPTRGWLPALERQPAAQKRRSVK